MISDIERNRSDLEELCRRFGVSRLEAFGSADTGRFQSDTGDIDLLVEFRLPNGPGCAGRCFGLLELLEALFQRPVDVVVASAIKNPYFRQSVDETRTLLYAA